MAQILDEEAGVLVPSGLPSRPEHPVQHTLSEVAAFVGADLDLSRRDLSVSGLAQDSRRARAGDLYVARPGVHAHGAAFTGQAAAAGAVAVLTDPAGREQAERAGLPTLVVDDPREVLGRLSAWIYGEPATAMTMLGVTGTNGKTTTTYLLEAALTQAGHRAGLIGTIESRIAGQAMTSFGPSARTTPEAPDLHALFAVMRERAVTAVAMEVSSHALTYGRVDGLVFDVAGFTNLSQDHLEIHGDLESYYQAKASLFTPERARAAVVNIDDAHGARLAREATIPVVTLSPSGAEADWRVRNRRATAYGGTAFDLLGPGGVELTAEVGIPGEFNVANAALALVMLEAAGLEAKTVATALAAATVPGRMERFTGPSGVAGPKYVLVDYAHTPDAIAVALSAIAPVVPGRLFVVFGCGGDRDQVKRPLMGRAAAAGADVAVVTDDNPRSEDAATIRAAALEGTKLVPEAERADVVEIADRREAIRWAIGQAGPDDIVMVLGKGHEQGQEIAGVVHPFDDGAEVREALAGARQ
ncbi:UDP-N-acetylmuramoyl-L-alanyl-D-glutamate--2,6-diaminopimelate ligase [Flindersiella endophytica]